MCIRDREIPAGKLDDPKEPKIECAYRELEEETGFKTEKLEYLISVNTTVAFCDEAIDIFVAHNLVPSHQHPVSYTHLDVYKRQVLPLQNPLHVNLSFWQRFR